MSQLSPVDLGNLWPEVQGICNAVVAGDVENAAQAALRLLLETGGAVREGAGPKT